MSPPPPPQSASLKFRQGAYLPHWTKQGAVYHVVFRVGDSLPRQVLEGYIREREGIVKTAAAMGRELTEHERRRLDELHSEKVERYLDAGHGACPMKDERIASMVEAALKHFEGTRYDLAAWAVMPNHVHAVVRPREGHELADILHSWKSFTSNEANKLLGKRNSGEPFWQPEYYDHFVRDAADFSRCVEYVLENPTVAGLKSWPWVGERGTGFQPHLSAHFGAFLGG